MDVFISYSTKDQIHVDALDMAIRRAGRTPWQSDKDLRDGSGWATQIRDRIDNCRVFLFVISEHAMASEWCLRELQHAAIIGKPILPILLSPSLTVTSPLSDIQYIAYPSSTASQSDWTIFGARLGSALRDAQPIPKALVPREWTTLDRTENNDLPKAETTQSDIPLPKIRGTITDKRKQDFLFDGLAAIYDYFQRGLNALEADNTRVETTIRKNSDTDFGCQIFVDGMRKQQCRIFIGGAMLIRDAIAYSEAISPFGNNPNNTYNEIIHMEEIDGDLKFKFMLTGVTGSYSRMQAYSAEDVARALWLRLTERLSY
ncbi:MAG: toll/interleukin-1 receptor domain-containing protein [Pseudomonadales bacterium]|nr:toll/interleukin-1 receptor domain-containing protein [Pseudomonadales bacterium]